MAVLLPPQPVGVPPDSGLWNDWYQKLRDLINNGAVTVTWSSINFTGSNITSIVNRAHNNLQSLQGGAAGEYFHLTAAQYASLGAGAHNSLTSIQGGTAGQYYHLDLADFNAVGGTRITKGTDTTDDLIVDDTAKGLVLKSPDGHYWRLSVDNAGALTTTDLGTSKP